MFGKHQLEARKLEGWGPIFKILDVSKLREKTFLAYVGIKDPVTTTLLTLLDGHKGSDKPCIDMLPGYYFCCTNMLKLPFNGTKSHFQICIGLIRYVIVCQILVDC